MTQTHPRTDALSLSITPHRLELAVAALLRGDAALYAELLDGLYRATAGQDGPDVVDRVFATAKAVLAKRAGAARTNAELDAIEACGDRATAIELARTAGIKTGLALAAQATPAGQPGALMTMDELERQHIGRALLATRGNVTKAARALGINRRTLYRRIESLGIPRPGRYVKELAS